MLGSFAGAAVTTVLAASVGLMVPMLSGRMALTASAVLLFWSLVNVRGVALGTRLNTIVTVAKLLPLMMLVIIREAGGCCTREAR